MVISDDGSLIDTYHNQRSYHFGLIEIEYIFEIVYGIELQCMAVYYYYNYKYILI